jgi:SAM-dependent methyltransferase
MDPDQIRNHKAFDSRWYHSIELAPGLFTPGKPRMPVALTRELLRHVDVEGGAGNGSGARCLDIGLQEGMVSTLMERRGASQVIGYDRVFRKGRLALVKEALQGKFELIGDMKLQDFPEVLVEAGIDPFDLVIFSGVFYHMFDPLGGLAVVRGLVRDGGICLVETTFAMDDANAMFLNSFGRFTAGGMPMKERTARPEGMMPGSLSCYWYTTPTCLDYMLRFLRFEPLDVVYFHVDDAVGDKPPEGRMAVACRAIPEPLAEPGDEWIEASQRPGLFSEFLDWDRVSSELPEIGYEASREGLVKGEAGSVDLKASMDSIGEFKVEEDQTHLTLDAKY